MMSKEIEIKLKLNILSNDYLQWNMFNSFMEPLYNEVLFKSPVCKLLESVTKLEAVGNFPKLVSFSVER